MIKSYSYGNLTFVFSNCSIFQSCLVGSSVCLMALEKYLNIHGCLVVRCWHVIHAYAVALVRGNILYEIPRSLWIERQLIIQPSHLDVLFFVILFFRQKLLGRLWHCMTRQIDNPSWHMIQFLDYTALRIFPYYPSYIGMCQ